MSDHNASDHHVTGLPVYFSVFLFLMVMTAVTVWAAFQEFGGAMNDIVAMAIAGAKATIVILFFMHVRHGSRLAKISVVSGFVWFAILIGILLTDYMTRGFINL